jgi:hypothetical protein
MASMMRPSAQFLEGAPASGPAQAKGSRALGRRPPMPGWPPERAPAIGLHGTMEALAETMQFGFNAKTQRRKGNKRYSLAEGLSPFGDVVLQISIHFASLRPCDFALISSRLTAWIRLRRREKRCFCQTNPFWVFQKSPEVVHTEEFTCRNDCGQKTTD